MQFTVTINCDGADLHDGHPAALGVMLMDLGDRIRGGDMPSVLLDRNGNTVGSVELTDD